MTVAIIDGPLPADLPGLVHRESLVGAAGDPHAAAHAAALAAAVRAAAPQARLVNLVVFGRGLATDAGTVARAVDRAAELAPAIVLCAFGMARRDDALAAAVARLIATGAILVAAAPARGGIAYPAAFPGVVAVQGDARCAPGAWSRLDLPHAAFGACPAGDGDPGGASIAAAHFAGHLARRLATGQQPADALASLAREAQFKGRERRGLAPRPDVAAEETHDQRN